MPDKCFYLLPFFALVLNGDHVVTSIHSYCQEKEKLELMEKNNCIFEISDLKLVKISFLNLCNLHRIFLCNDTVMASFQLFLKFVFMAILRLNLDTRIKYRYMKQMNKQI